MDLHLQRGLNTGREVSAQLPKLMVYLGPHRAALQYQHSGRSPLIGERPDRVDSTRSVLDY